MVSFGARKPGLSLNRRYTGLCTLSRARLENMSIGFAHLRALKAFATAAFVAVLLALSPSTAKAHAGHGHSHAAVQQSSQLAESRTDTAQELRSAPLWQARIADDGCVSRGCCDLGSCAGGCHGFVLAALPDTIPPRLSRLLTAGDASLHPIPHVHRLRRPPKSFA